MFIFSKNPEKHIKIFNHTTFPPQKQLNICLIPLTLYNTQLKLLIHLQKTKDLKRAFVLKYIIFFHRNDCWLRLIFLCYLLDLLHSQAVKKYDLDGFLCRHAINCSYYCLVWRGFALSKYCVVEGKGMQCGFLAFRDLNGHLCPMLITLESPGP